MFMFMIAGPIMEKMAGRPDIDGFQFIWQLVSSSVPAMLFVLLVISNILVDFLVLRNINNAKYNVWLFIPNLCVMSFIFLKASQDYFLFFNFCLLTFFCYKVYKYYKYYSHYRQYVNQKHVC